MLLKVLGKIFGRPSPRFALVWLSLGLSGSIGAAETKTLPHHVPSVVARLSAVGTLPGTNQLDLAIGLPLRNTNDLQALLGRLYDPASPDFRHYLTPEQFTARFGPTLQDYQAVSDFAAQNHLGVRTTHGNRLVLDVTGSVSNIERAFRITLKVYHHPTEARDFYSPDSEPVVDASLPIADISGLNNLTLPHPAGLSAIPSEVSNATPKTGSGPAGTFIGDDLRAAYLPAVTLTGTGQTLGLLEFSGYYAADITAYESKADITAVPLVNVPIDGYNGAPTQQGDVEVSADIEMAVSLAPGLTQIVVFDAGPGGLQDDILEAMVASNSISQFSCSWGWGGGPNFTTDSIFQQMMAQGQTFFNASGDSDAFTATATSDNGVDNTSLACAPSSCPYITQVGGTTMKTSGPKGTWASESVWNWGKVGTNYLGSSGGISSYYSIPTWQAGVGTTANGGSSYYRNIPDVAANADNVYITYNNGGTTTNIGGTSVAAPLWGALAALINEQARASGGSTIGFVNSALYSLGKSSGYAASFHDITTGNNEWPGSASSYSAVTGYDLCTGWGTPAGQSLINALAGNQALKISPTNGFSATGSTGGPFNTNSEVFTLNNAGYSPLKWGVASLPSWLSASAASGTLAEQSSGTVTLSLNTNAYTLGAGTYASSVPITNSANSLTQTILFSLQISEPLFILPTTGLLATGYVGGPFIPNSGAFVLTNAGNSTLSWSASTVAAWVTVSPASGSLASFASTPLTISLNAAAANLPVGTHTALTTFIDSDTGASRVFEVVLKVNEALAIGPTNGLTASGPPTGPFSLTASNVTLVNLGNSPLKWDVGAPPAWLALTPASGTLPGNSTNVLTASLTSATKSLPGGGYTNLLVFNDVTGQNSQDLPVVLQVGQSIVQNGGFETGTFTNWTLAGNTTNGNLVYNAVVSTSSQYPLAVHSGNYGAFLGDSTYATLSQKLATVPGESYLVSFWLDNPISGAAQQFRFSWITNTATASQIYYVTNPPVLTWTNFVYVLLATGTNSEIQFGAQNIPNFFGLDDVSVAPIPNPAIVSVSRAGASLGMTLYTVTGLSYQLLYATNLAQTNWVPLSTNTASGNILTITNNPGTNQQRFYRIRQLPL